MVNEILMRGATPVAIPQPVEAPAAPTQAAGDDFSRALLAELDGPAPAATRSAATAPSLTEPKALTLDTIPVAPPVMLAPPTPPAAPAGQTYTVQAGDTLSKIARKLGGGGWQTLYAANKSVVGANPNMIHPGQILTLPAAWQTAGTPPVAQPRVQAAVEPAAQAPTQVAGTPPAQVPSAPVIAPPSLPLEAAPDPGTLEALPAPEARGIPAAVGIATEAIDRLSTEPGGGQDHMAILRAALESIPPGHASYEAYRAKVDAYGAAVGAGGSLGAGLPVGGPAPTMPAPSLPGAGADATDPLGGAGLTAPPREDAYGPMGPGGATIEAQVSQPATSVVAPVPAAEDDGEADWQAFS